MHKRLFRGRFCFSSFSLGFTLVEMLVVISIIGILLAISYVGFSQSRIGGRDSKRKADLEQIRSALEIYRNDCKTYPLTGEVVQGTLLEGTMSSGDSCLTTDIYMEVVPSDPLTSCQYAYSSASSNTYVFCAHLEGAGAGGTAPGGCGSCGGASCTCNYKVVNP